MDANKALRADEMKAFFAEQKTTPEEGPVYSETRRIDIGGVKGIVCAAAVVLASNKEERTRSVATIIAGRPDDADMIVSRNVCFERVELDAMLQPRWRCSRTTDIEDDGLGVVSSVKPGGAEAFLDMIDKASTALGGASGKKLADAGCTIAAHELWHLSEEHTGPMIVEACNRVEKAISEECF